MTPKATVRHSGDVSIVDLAGKITLGDGTGLVRATVKELIAAGNRNILLNLSNVTYLDSAGLGEVVGSYATVANLGGAVKLLNPQGKVKDLLQVTKLYAVFVTFTDEASAVSSFAAAAPA
jgi:anti-sigma B factor antagonist